MIKLSQASLGSEENKCIEEVLSQKYLGMGFFTKQFEEKLKGYIGENVEVSCVNTGTSALHLAAQAINIESGDEVIIPTVTYVASFQAISATGAKPIPCDICIDSGLLDIKDAEKKITTRTKALMHVHYAGNVGNIEEVHAFVKKYNLRLIEDAAHSFGGNYENKKIGSFGDITCFSFDSIKNITCGEGGAVVSSDIKVIEKVKDYRLLGVKNDTEKRFSQQRSWDFDVSEQGWRYHMSNINAAIGIAQLEKIEVLKAKRRLIAEKYFNQLRDCPNISLISMDLNNIMPHIFPLRINASKRNGLKKFLFERGIETGLHYKPNHLLTKYKSAPLPSAEKFWEETLTLPLHANLSIKDIDFICENILSYLN